MKTTTLFVLAVLAAAPAQAAAQQQPEPSQLRPVRIAKWTLLAGAAGAALYGLDQNQRADEAYTQLEALCLARTVQCRARDAAGAYTDAELERQYQVVRDHDGRARTSLIAGQVAVALSAALFILDLRNNRPPDNIPYDPGRFQVGPAADGGLRAGLRLRLP